MWGVIQSWQRSPADGSFRVLSKHFRSPLPSVGHRRFKGLGFRVWRLGTSAHTGDRRWLRVLGSLLTLMDDRAGGAVKIEDCPVDIPLHNRRQGVRAGIIGARGSHRVHGALMGERGLCLRV